ncbi:MAG: hypothetical protein QOG76_2485, partial [Pseudonocardiales bacterium]|nr:hypothetical protein [Pseudonocardiales bacterium]
MVNSGMRRNETIELRPDQFVCRFGGATLNAPIIGGSIRYTVNERPSALVHVDLSDPESCYVDLASALTVHQLLDTCERLVFTGSVKQVSHLDTHTEVHAEMGQELVGVASSLIAHQNCPIELLYSITATAGVSFRNEGPPLSEDERMFVIICPIAGVTVA